MNMITLTRTCPFCGKLHSITVDREEFQRGSALYRYGELIQDCFPNFTPDEREWIKTGICPTCWDSL